MKIYFTGSVSGLDEYKENYTKIVDTLERLGHRVYEETTKVTEEYVYDEISDEDKINYYKKTLKWMNAADIIVVEASHPSLSIGHELSVALEKGKPVIVLYSQGKAPHFLVGVQSEKLIVEKYSLDDLKQTLESALEYASEQQDTRFNFFISPKIANYLDWISREKRIPRAVYLRRLIEEDMREREDAE